jgi:uncharacterized membrane protein YhfC
MLYIAYTLNILLLFAIPIALGIFLVRKFYLEGRWWWIGAIVYFFSQIIVQPLQNYVINPYLNGLSYSGVLPSVEILILGGLGLGLSVSVCEELLRYVMMRWWAKDARSFESGVLLGAGHGGAASIILAGLVIYNFVNMIFYRNMDLPTLVPVGQLQMVQSQIAAFWSVPWYYAIREAIGQIFMLSIQICLSVMVLQCFVRKQWYWILLAIGFHSTVETARVITLNLSNEYLMYAVLGIFAIFSGIITFALRQPKPSEIASEYLTNQTNRPDQMDHKRQ